MIEAVLTGSGGHWSPNSILASFDDADYGPTDRMLGAEGGLSGTDLPSGGVSSFERILAEEQLKASKPASFEDGLERSLRAPPGKFGDSQQADVGQTDDINSASRSRADATDDIAAAGPYRQVGLESDGALSERSVDREDRSGPAFETREDVAFWIGDRVVTHDAFPNHGASWVDDAFDVPVMNGRVFLNGEGRPILMSSIEPGIDVEPARHESPPDEGDLMILPNGTVLAYDPWTSAVDGNSPL